MTICTCYGFQSTMFQPQNESPLPKKQLFFFTSKIKKDVALFLLTGYPQVTFGVLLCILHRRVRTYRTFI